MPVVGVVSDTHLPRFGRRLPPALLDGLSAAGVDLILHAGDITAPFVLDVLGTLAPVEAVAGNNDPPELVERLGVVRSVEIASRAIGLTHGHLGRGSTTPERALRTFEADSVDLVVFGHSHRPLWVPPSTGRPALLNPGSPTDRRGQPDFSFAILTLPDDAEADIEVRFERYRDRSPTDDA
jgi:putative phosphoesterase